MKFENFSQSSPDCFINIAASTSAANPDNAAIIIANLASFLIFG